MGRVTSVTRTPWTHILPRSCLTQRLHPNISVGQVLGSPNLSAGADPGLARSRVSQWLAPSAPNTGVGDQ